MYIFNKSILNKLLLNFLLFFTAYSSLQNLPDKQNKTEAELIEHAQEKEKSNSFREAITYYLAAIKINPNSSFYHHACGRVYRKLKEFEVAIEYLLKQ